VLGALRRTRLGRRAFVEGSRSDRRETR